MFEVDGNFGGFFQDSIHFGLFVTTGFLVSLFLRYNSYNKDKSIFNLILLIVYLGISLFTSRNSILIILVTIIYLFLVPKAKNKIIIFLIILLPIFIINSDIIFHGLNEDSINEFTSGRSTIWSLAISKIIENNILIGHGLFNVNDMVLQENVGIGFYYLDKIENLSFHSSYVELFAGGGLIVVIVFFRIIIKSLSRLNGVDKGILVGVLIGGLFESFLTQPFMLISCLFYFILFANNMKIVVKSKRKT